MAIGDRHQNMKVKYTSLALNPGCQFPLLGELLKNTLLWDIPGGPVVKNLPANAGDVDLIIGPGRSHVPWDNEACAPQALTPASLEPSLCNKRSHSNTSVRCEEEEPLLAAVRESPHAATKTPHSRKQTDRRCVSFNLDQ